MMLGRSGWPMHDAGPVGWPMHDAGPVGRPMHDAGLVCVYVRVCGCVCGRPAESMHDAQLKVDPPSLYYRSTFR